MGYCRLFLSFCNPGSSCFPIQRPQESAGGWGGGGGRVCRLPDGSLYIHEASHPGRVWSRKKVSGFRGLEHVNAIKPIILKPIEWRIMVSCRYNASMKPHPRASFRSLGYFLILLPSASVVFLVSSFCGAREGTREGKRRRVCSRNFCLRPKKTAPAPCQQSPFHSSWGMIRDRGRPPLPRFYIKKSSKRLC